MLKAQSLCQSGESMRLRVLDQSEALMTISFIYIYKYINRYVYIYIYIARTIVRSIGERRLRRAGYRVIHMLKAQSLCQSGGSMRFPGERSINDNTLFIYIYKYINRYVYIYICTYVSHTIVRSIGLWLQCYPYVHVVCIYIYTYSFRRPGAFQVDCLFTVLVVASVFHL
jgi:hypothetical protein